MADTNLYAQLAKAQAEFTSPKRTKEVTGAYRFTYAPLDECLDAVRPALAKHGLFLTQGLVTQNGVEQIRTAVYYGEAFIENFWPLLNTQPGAQKHGGAGTFARRYGVCSLLGLAPEDDDDANASEGNAVTITDRRAPPKPVNGNAKVKPLPQSLSVKDVYNPETGEIEGVKPQAIDYDPKEPIAWGGRLVAEITGTRNRATAEAWIAANETNLAKCEADAPKVFARITANIKAMREKLEWPIPADFMAVQ